MKTIVFLFCAFLFVQNTQAQKDINLAINHTLGSSSFAFNQTASNNLTNDFQVTRLEYYISDIVLYHDGTQTPVTNKFILVNGGTTTNELLGTFNITNLDSISFGIGVGPNENHLDPASYQMTHPLAPKSPSMHWGWTSGYRFVALEGVSGFSMTDVFQMHGLGDANYKMTTITTAGNLSGNTLDIVINADYTQALKDINVTGGVISHSETGEARTVLNNFNTDVFSDGANSVSIVKLETIDLSIFPNPVQLGEAVTIQINDASNLSFEVYDMVGKQYKDVIYSSTNQSMEFMDAGIYIIHVLKDGKAVATQKISVNK